MDSSTYEYHESSFDESSDDDPSQAVSGSKELESDDEADADSVDDDVVHIEEQLRCNGVSSSNMKLDLMSGDILFDGNLHPPEFYRRGIESLDEESYDRKEYSPTFTVLIDQAEKQWRMYVDVFV